MALVKVLKSKAYFKRFQVKRRRRREGKTDYQARIKMVKQAKNKYNAKKHRLIIRFTNRKVIAQIAYSTIRGDMIIASADSSELAKFGVPVGLKNYAAAYCTGLLVARRALKKLGLDDMFKGKEEADGEDFHIEDEESEQRPFKCILDVGLQRTTVGHRMWAALKGAVDGGIHVPHTNKKFPGYVAPEEKGQEAEYDADAHRAKIFSENVKEYMETMQEEDPTKYEAHFAKYIENDIDADKIEEMYTEAHEKIRENPDREVAENKGITQTREGDQRENVTSSDGTSHVRFAKLTLELRRAKVQAKIAAAQAKVMGGDDMEDDE